MSTGGPARRLARVSVLLALAALSACGQMGPLQLPETAEPVSEPNPDEERDDDER